MFFVVRKMCHRPTNPWWDHATAIICQSVGQQGKRSSSTIFNLLKDVEEKIAQMRIVHPVLDFKSFPLMMLQLKHLTFINVNLRYVRSTHQRFHEQLNLKHLQHHLVLMLKVQHQKPAQQGSIHLGLLKWISQHLSSIVANSRWCLLQSNLSFLVVVQTTYQIQKILVSWKKIQGSIQD